jgi:replicative DNA helicase
MRTQNYLQPIEERGLPCDVDAERFILGSMLLDSAGFMPAALETLTEDDFSTARHRLIFARSRDLFNDSGRIDRVTLAHTLRERGELESVEGISYLVSLDEGLPRLPNLDGYLRIVRDASLKRRAIFAHQKAINEIMLGQGDADELLARAEASVMEVSHRAGEDGEFETPAQIVLSAGGIDGYLRRRRASGVPTHIPSLNGLTRGLQAGSLNILAARTSRGKTAFALNVAHHAAIRTDEAVVVFSQEMNKQEINDRLICLAGGVSFADLHEHVDTDRMRRAFNAAAALPILIRDAAATVPAIQAKVRRLMTKRKIALVVIDYLQLLTPAGRFENRTQEVSAMSRGLKLVAQELGIPFLVLSQLKRFEGNREPELSDLRESGSIEQDANTVMFLHSDREFVDLDANVPAPMQLILAKQRSGPVGRIELAFQLRTGHFTEISDRGAA